MSIGNELKNSTIFYSSEFKPNENGDLVLLEKYVFFQKEDSKIKLTNEDTKNLYDIIRYLGDIK